jgi:hypothetical protein
MPNQNTESEFGPHKAQEAQEIDRWSRICSGPSAPFELPVAILNRNQKLNPHTLVCKLHKPPNLRENQRTISEN